mmetsp:Transcript_19800/g.61024  ORF Transcript_19800/g.61024 Transcript_19800/m.61024 type:complete len:100 (+) Transcript_19800:99-398(+)
MASPPMYVRVKRKTTTIFLNVEKSDSFGGIKAKIGEIIDVPATSVRLFTTPDMATGETVDTAFVDNFVESDAVLYMILKKEGSESWEEIDVAEAQKPAA